MATLSSDGVSKHSKRKDVNELHRELGQPGEDVTRATGKHMDLKITGTFTPCKGCEVAKAKQSRMNKGVTSKKNPGKRIFIDISSPMTVNLGGKHRWLLVVDDCTNMTWSYFLKKKSETSDKSLSLIKNLKSKYEIVVKIVFCDNEGENIALQHTCEKESLGVSFGLKAPGTHNKMGKLNRNSLPCTVRCALCCTEATLRGHLDSVVGQGVTHRDGTGPNFREI